MTKSANWKKEDDAKLLALMQKGPYKGGVSTTDLTAKTIHKVLDKFFPEKKYQNFAPLFRKKARAFVIDQELSGSRKKKKGKQPHALRPCFC